MSLGETRSGREPSAESGDRRKCGFKVGDELKRRVMLPLAQAKGSTPLLASRGVECRARAIQPLADIDAAEGPALERPRRETRIRWGAPEQGERMLEQSHEFGRREIRLGRADDEIEEDAWHRVRHRHARGIVNCKLVAL